MRTRIILIVGAILLAAHMSARAENYVRETLLISIGGANLEAVFIKLEGNERRPLALLNHGSPRDANSRPDMSAFGLYSQAIEFARRGWNVAMVLRRGYGGSGGSWAEDYGKCDSASYEIAGLRGAEDLRETLLFLAKRPDVDPTRMISVGVSAGGFATVALTANPPPGLVAAINFAGGRGSQQDDKICSVHALIDAFRVYGKTSRLPMLWVYAVNDKYFGPQPAAMFKDAFASGGGTLNFVQAAAYGEDGHALFSSGGIPIWTPVVDEFLKAQGLALRATPAGLPNLPNIAPPSQLSSNGRNAFESYLRAGPHKAFAVSEKGSFSWRSGQRTAAKAKDDALAACQRANTGSCSVRVDDGEPK